MVRRHQHVRLVLVAVRDFGRRCSYGRCGRRGRTARRRRLQGVRQSGEVVPIRVPLSVHLRHDVLVVVVAQRAAQFVVVHVRLVFSLAPPSGHLVGVDEFELARCPLPRDDRRVVAVGEELEQELPQLDLTAARVGQAGGERTEQLVRVCNRQQAM